MKFLKRKNIDQAKWDDCITKSPNGLVYGLTWFLDGMVENWDGLVWEDGDKYSAVFPIPTRSKFGLKYVYPPFFIQQLGLFCTVNDFEKKETKAIAFLRKKFRFAELNLNFQSSKGEKRVNLILSLKDEYELLFEKYSQNHKRNLKKALKFGYEVKSANVKEVIALFQNDRGASLTTYTEKDYQNFEALVNNPEHKTNVFVKGVFRSNQMICGAVFMKFKNRIIFLFSGNSQPGKDAGALFQLLNSIVESYAKSGFVLDFEGSQNEGLARFYKGFGAEEQSYKFYKHNKLPGFLKKLKK